MKHFLKSNEIIQILFVLLLLWQPSANAEAISLEPMLRSQNTIALAEKWKAKIWIGRVSRSSINRVSKDAVWYDYNAFYKDSDRDGIVNPADSGFFEPGSTIKVAVAAAYLEKHPELSIEMRKKMQDMLVVSDNEASNSIISALGFQAINESALRRNIQNHIVSRFMLTQRGEKDFGCHEVENVPGNCATAQALTGVMLRLVRPDWFYEDERFEIKEDSRKWMLEKMKSVPSEVGYEGYSDENCRLLQRSYVTLKEQNAIDAAFVKCGISPKSNHWTELNYIRGTGPVDLVSVFSVAAGGKEDEEIYQTMNKIALPIYSELLSQ